MMRKRKTSHKRSLKKEARPASFEAEAGALHQPVLLREVLDYLDIGAGVFVDATLGMGGHSEAILKASDSAQVLGIDRDREAIAKASERLKDFGERFRPFHADYREIKEVLEKANVENVDGVLADLGVSSWQLDAAERGFSFRFDAPLDMRMNAGSDEPTAAELLKELDEEEIARIIYEYGEERFSRRIARRIVERRERGEPLETTRELVELVETVIKPKWNDRIHPATRTFQALRIAVNQELEGMGDFVRDAIDVLKPGGRLAIISFHSLEDRIIKQTFRQQAGRCECPPRMPVCQCGAVKRIEILTARPVTASEEENETNPRARSAKLRVCKKLKAEDI